LVSGRWQDSVRARKTEMDRDRGTLIESVLMSEGTSMLTATETDTETEKETEKETETETETET
jgi:hypothetical protein